MKTRLIISLFILINLQVYAQSVSISHYGARGDGLTDNTPYLQKAIDDCPEKGGTILIPPGTFLISPVHLKSNICIQLKKGLRCSEIRTSKFIILLPQRLYITKPWLCSMAIRLKT